MRLSRRTLTRGLAGAGLAMGLGLPGAGRAAELSTEDFARRLQADLDGCIDPGCPVTKLTVLDFALAQTARGLRPTFRANALVRLDWPPGMRQRPFLFYGPEPRIACDGLRDRVVAEFAAVHPDCIVSG